MKRNMIVSIATVLMLAAGYVQANDILVATGFTSENVIVDSASMTGAGGGSYEDPNWKEEYPFPRHFGPAVD
jgi:hypothetical protein